MTNNKDRDEWDAFYEERATKNLLLQLKNPLSWYGSARRSMSLANKIRGRIEEDIPTVNEGDDQFFPGVFTPNRLGDVFWLQTLRAEIRNDLSGDGFVGVEVNFDTEDTIDKHGIDMMPEPKYRKLHPLYPIYLYFIGEHQTSFKRQMAALKESCAHDPLIRIAVFTRLMHSHVKRSTLTSKQLSYETVLIYKQKL
jgi:hypothetical protein